jgi:hypothetical protein
MCQDWSFDFLRAFFGHRYLRTAMRTSGYQVPSPPNNLSERGIGHDQTPRD